MSEKQDAQEILEQELEASSKEVRRLKADNRRIRRILRSTEEEAQVANRLIGVVRDSVLALEPIEVPAFDVSEGAEGEEVAVLMLSDIHIGKKTASYNPNVFAKRLAQLEERMASIVAAHRSIRPIRKLVLMFNGDFADGESLYKSQGIDFISIPIIDQLFSVGVPRLAEFIYFCLSLFEEVEIRATRGNHGKMTGNASWRSSRSTNWDLVLYKALEVATANQPRLTWHIYDKDWKALYWIEGHGFLQTHGDSIRRYYSTPHYGMQRQAQRWCNAYRDRIKLTYFCYSHFHSICTGQRFNDVVILVNGCFTTGDVYAEENLGVTSIPEQLFFGVHRKHGVTWRYPIRLK